MEKSEISEVLKNYFGHLSFKNEVQEKAVLKILEGY